jgi:hypothetical protein
VWGIGGNKPDKHQNVRGSVFKNPLHTKEHVSHVLGMNGNTPEESPILRIQALESPHATKDHFLKAQKDWNPQVRYKATEKLKELRNQESENVQEGVQTDTSKKIADVLNKIHQRSIKRSGIIPPVKTAPTKKQPRKSLQQRHLQLITSKP